MVIERLISSVSTKEPKTCVICFGPRIPQFFVLSSYLIRLLHSRGVIPILLILLDKLSPNSSSAICVVSLAHTNCCNEQL